jgi:hypothetical protein
LYARFQSAGSLAQFFQGALDGNGLVDGTGDCTTATLSGSAAAGDYCAGTYTDANGESGSEALFLGSSFELQGSTASVCSQFGLGGSGASVLIWTTPAKSLFGLGMDCTASTPQFVDGMETDLLDGNYDLQS